MLDLSLYIFLACVILYTLRIVPQRMIVIQSETSQTAVAQRVIECKTFLSKKLGLLNHSNLKIGDGLLLVGSNAIHTKNMHIDIDIVFLDENQRILALHSSIEPGHKRLRGPKGSKFVLELGSGTLAQHGALKIGSRLVWSEVSHV